MSSSKSPSGFSFKLTPQNRPQYRKDGNVVAQSRVPSATKKSLVKRALGTTQLENQPLEVYLNMTKNMNAGDVYELCRTSRVLNQVICKNPDFWAQWAGKQSGVRLQNQPIEIYVKILSEMDFEDVVEFCGTSKFLRFSVCQNRDFWRAWFKKHNRREKITIAQELLNDLFEIRKKIEPNLVQFYKIIDYNIWNKLDSRFAREEYINGFVKLIESKLQHFDIWKYAMHGFVKRTFQLDDIAEFCYMTSREKYCQDPAFWKPFIEKFNRQGLQAGILEDSASQKMLHNMYRELSSAKNATKLSVETRALLQFDDMRKKTFNMYLRTGNYNIKNIVRILKELNVPIKIDF